MEFGMPTLIENATIEENVKLCSELGLQFIELNMNFPEYQLSGIEDTNKLYKIADKVGVYYTIHLDENLNIADFNILVANAYLDTVKRTISVAKKLLPLQNKYGTSWQPFVINMHMNHGIYITLPDKKVQMYDRDFDMYIQSFINFRLLCEEWIGNANIMICIENTNGFREYEKKAIEYLLDSPKFGLTWDIGHSKAVQEVDESFIMEHLDRLRHFHIHDAIASSKKCKAADHLALGDGEIDINAKIELAEKTNSKCVLETKTIQALKSSVSFIKSNKLNR